VVNEFVGAKDPRFLTTFLQSLTPSPVAEAMEQATKLLGERNFTGAAELLRPLVAATQGVEPEKQAELRIMLAEIYLGLGPVHYAEVAPLLDGLDSRSQAAERGELLRQILSFFESAQAATGDEAERLAKDPKDAAAHLTLAAVEASHSRFEAAFSHLLWLIEHNRRFGDDAGRKNLLALFAYLGSDVPAVFEARRRLQVIL
jgi:putative thioredoxin